MLVVSYFGLGHTINTIDSGTNYVHRLIDPTVGSG
jgi:hypothetical protein